MTPLMTDKFTRLTYGDSTNTNILIICLTVEYVSQKIATKQTKTNATK